MVELYKYQGAGNDFIVVDGRVSAGHSAAFVDEDFICQICDRRYGIGADGVMVLEDSEEYDFKMVYYNSDGSGGMMCGNGGRCIAAFALYLGIGSPDDSVDGSDDESTDYSVVGSSVDDESVDWVSDIDKSLVGRMLSFEAADGPHEACLMPDGDIRLKMRDVEDYEIYDENSYRLDTGTKHFVKFVANLSDVDVVGEGREIRYREEFAPIGTNVNFVEVADGGLFIRTYEKGVEDETYACGTGIVASCLAAYHRGVVPSEIIIPESNGNLESERVRYDVEALRDSLSVDFVPDAVNGNAVRDIWLKGPAIQVAKIII